MSQHDFNIQCPYCGEQIWMEFYPEDGNQQEMIIDCEVCCNPILYSVKFSSRERPELRVERAQ
jgi:DNA-directed RNA polymerase subunit RPC12/RpoP